MLNELTVGVDALLAGVILNKTRTAVPWLKDVDPAALSEVIQTRKDAREVMEISATEEVNRLATEAGIPASKDDRDRIAYLVGAEIARNDTLNKLWKAGNMSAVSKACSPGNERPA